MIVNALIDNLPLCAEKMAGRFIYLHETETQLEAHAQGARTLQ